jgi:butyrate kinase
LVINPGSTSTKIAVYDDERELCLKTIDHSEEDLAPFEEALDQFGYRASIVREALAEWQVDPQSLSAVIGRGNLLPRMKGGGYRVDENMVAALKAGKASPHASNLGALIAYSVAEPLGVPAYIYDSVTADEMTPIAKVTGMPGIERESMCHVLNMRAVSRKLAKEKGRKYEDMNLLVAHLGGGITISVHCGGRIVDAIRDDSGPFSPERAGSVPLLYVIDMCYSGQYQKKDMIKFIRGQGGLKAFLGTADARKIESMIMSGDEKAKLLYEAQAYQIAKGIGELAPVVNGQIDYIVMTGGLAHSKMLTGMVAERVKFIAPIEIIPGENEMEALALGAKRLLEGEPCHYYGEDGETRCM